MNTPSTTLPDAKTIGMVSLGCPKALVDSERILTRLRAEGYAISPDYAGAEAVIVNTCGFLDSAKAESLEAIGEALSENGRVIVTGCLGADEALIRESHPSVLAVTGPHQYEQVLDAVHNAVPPAPDPKIDLIPAAGIRLTPRHYAYLKISEGCNHSCRFCIIPSMRGKLASRPARAVLREAEKLAEAGVRELLVISQDTSAYGTDLRHADGAHIVDLAEALGGLGVWVRLHYIYPYPHVDRLIPLMADGLVTPYLDIPFQHASPSVLRAMRRPANEAKTLERIRAWREICPELTVRSTFIVGFPGETEQTIRESISLVEQAQPTFWRAQLWYADPVTPIWKEKDHYNIQGEGFEWSHATMNSKHACDVIDDMFVNMKNSSWLPQWGFEFWSTFYLQRKGMPKAQLTSFVDAFNNVIKDKLRGGHREARADGPIQDVARLAKFGSEASKSSASPSVPVVNTSPSTVQPRIEKQHVEKQRVEEQRA